MGAALVLSWLAGIGPARAIPNTCPTSGPDVGTVTITEPAANVTLSGQVTVRGRASTPGGVTRVELFVGEALKDSQAIDPSQASVNFALRFDAAGVQSDTTTLAVVACGGRPGAAERGLTSVTLNVDRSAAAAVPGVKPAVATSTDHPRTGPLWAGLVFAGGALAGLVGATSGRRRGRTRARGRGRVGPTVL